MILVRLWHLFKHWGGTPVFPSHQHSSSRQAHLTFSSSLQPACACFITSFPESPLVWTILLSLSPPYSVSLHLSVLPHHALTTSANILQVVSFWTKGLSITTGNRKWLRADPWCRPYLHLQLHPTSATRDFLTQYDYIYLHSHKTKSCKVLPTYFKTWCPPVLWINVSIGSYPVN